MTISYVTLGKMLFDQVSIEQEVFGQTTFGSDGIKPNKILINMAFISKPCVKRHLIK